MAIRSTTRRLMILLAVAGAAAALALLVFEWGKPARPTYRVESGSASANGGVGEWAIERESAPAERWRARDTDGDGAWNEFLTPQGDFARPTRVSTQRWLVVCLDGVPLAMMQALWDQGHFREFLRPTATVSSLPSDTETALTEALHAEPVPGYEHRYFDRATNATRGGAWVTLTGTGIPYISKLDYDAPGWAKGMPYLLPERTYRADLERFRQTFARGHEKVFLAHIASSDALLHVRTAEQARPLLLEFDDELRGIYLDAHGALGIMVFSDHGNTGTPSRAAPIEAFLAAHVWRVRDSLREARDVVIPSYGLVGFAAVYCRPEATEPLAEDLRGVEGADLIVSRGPDVMAATIRAAGSRATATLEWSADGQRYRYAAHDGDPLGLAPVFDALRTAGKLDATGYASDADLWAATSAAPYPDSASRIRAWATGGVRNSADILVSLRPEYFHGASFFQDVVTLAGTHGGLDRTSSTGFAMATYPLPPVMRIGDVIPADLLRAASTNPRR